MESVRVRVLIVYREDEQMESPCRAEHLKEGSIFVTVLLLLLSDKFEVIAEEECLFSWVAKRFGCP